MSANRDRARALLANATPGPWNCQPHEPMRSDVYAVGCPDSTMIARVSRTPVNVMTSARRARPEYDAALIAAAPGLLAALCDENDALERRAQGVDAHAAIAHRSALEMVAHRTGLTLDSPTEQAICHALHLARSAGPDPKFGAGRGFVQYVEALRAERDALRVDLAMERATQSRELLTECARTLGAVGLVAVPGEVQRLVSERDVLQAGLAQEAALRAELTAEVKRLKAGNAVLGARVAIVCECVKSRQGPMGGSIARPLPGCDECGGTGGIIVDGDA